MSDESGLATHHSSLITHHSEYAELHCHSNYSLLDGASTPEELVAQAQALGLRALALTDHDGLYITPTFCRLAEAAGVQPIVGAEITLASELPPAALSERRPHPRPLSRWERGAQRAHSVTASPAGRGRPSGARTGEDAPPTHHSSLITHHSLPHLTLLAEDDTGYQNLCRLISLGRAARPKGEAALAPEQLAAHSAGLLALTGCRQGPLAAPLLAGQPEQAAAALGWLREVFGPARCWVELQRHYLPGERGLLRAQVALARRFGLGVVATNNVHYHVRARHRLQDVLVAIRHRTTLDASHHLRRPNAEYYLKSPAQMAHLFAELPEAVRNTLVLAERCPPLAALDATGARPAGNLARCALAAYRFPDYPLPPGETTDSFLAARCRAGALERYGTLAGEVWERLRHELDLIARHRLAGYFLIVWDLMEFARQHQIPAQGRGSAANSIVAYVLGLTNVDPIRHRLFVGRFLNEELSTLPDIDLDFSREHREQVLQYVYDRYGRDHAALVCTHITYQARSAIRDVGKALGLPPATLDRLAREQERYYLTPLPPFPSREGGGDGASSLPPFPQREGGAGEGRSWRLLAELCAEIHDFPRHLSQHVGGMVISSCPLNALVPLEPARMPGRVVTQWDKDGVQDSGLIKIDLLSLGMLSLVDEAVALVEAQTGQRPDLGALPPDDPAVYDMICRADTVGVFQIESRAQQQSLPRTQPRTFVDLIAQVSIIRPGPLQGNMVHPYVRRRRGEEKVTYLHPRLEPVLEETLGVILYQEQCLRVAIEIASFTAAEADALRRAMSRKRSRGAMDALRARFVEGAARNDVDAATANHVFDMLGGFAAYGFCKSHAASFAMLTYQSAWLRLYHAPAFYTALLNNQPMGFYSPEVVVNEARRQGVTILPVDINRSRTRCTLEATSSAPTPLHAARAPHSSLITHHASLAIRLGLRYVRQLGPAALARLEAERASGPFQSLSDCWRRTALPRAALENLILIGAFDSLGLERRALLWQLGLLGRAAGAQAALPLPTAQDAVALPALTAAEELQADYAISGLSPNQHPLGLLRAGLPPAVVSTAALRWVPAGQWAWLAGMIVCRQRPPTAKGFLFLTLEDEHGLANVIVRPDVYARDGRTINHEGLVLVGGVVQRQEDVLNLMARQVRPLAAARDLPSARSHDYA